MTAIKTASRFAIFAVIGLSGTGSAFAQTSIAYWNFNTATGTTMDATQRTNLATVTSGANSGSAFMNFNNISFIDGSTSSSTGITFFAGSTVSTTGFTEATGGSALAIQGGASTTTTDTVNNGKSFIFGASTSGYGSVKLSFAARNTASGFGNSPTTNQVDYSLNGGATWASAGTFTLTTTFANKDFDLSAVSGISNNSNARFRITVNGATSNVGNMRLDNLLIQGNTATIPEPSTVALLGLTLLPGAALLRRRRK